MFNNDLALQRVNDLENKIQMEKVQNKFKEKLQSFNFQCASSGLVEIFNLNYSTKDSAIINYSINISSAQSNSYSMYIYANSNLIKKIDFTNLSECFSDKIVCGESTNLVIKCSCNNMILKDFTLKISGNFFLDSHVSKDYVIINENDSYYVFKQNNNLYNLKTFSNTENLLNATDYINNATTFTNIVDVNQIILTQTIVFDSVNLLKIDSDGNLKISSSSDYFVSDTQISTSVLDAIVLPIKSNTFSKLILIRKSAGLTLLGLNSSNSSLLSQDIAIKLGANIKKLYSFKYKTGDTFDVVGFGFIDNLNKAYLVFCTNYSPSSTSFNFSNPIYIGSATDLNLNMIGGYLYSYLSENDIVMKIKIQPLLSNCTSVKTLSKMVNNNVSQIFNQGASEIFSYQNKFYVATS